MGSSTIVCPHSGRETHDDQTSTRCGSARGEQAMRSRALRWASLVLGLSLVAYAVESQEREPIRIGIIYTNTGPLAQLGIDMRDGALLYWSQAGNRAAGRRVEILAESTGS